MKLIVRATSKLPIESLMAIAIAIAIAIAMAIAIAIPYGNGNSNINIFTDIILGHTLVMGDTLDPNTPDTFVLGHTLVMGHTLVIGHTLGPNTPNSFCNGAHSCNGQYGQWQ